MTASIGLLTLLLFSLPPAADDVPGEIAVPAEGGEVEIDLTALKGVLPEGRFPKDSAGFLGTSKRENLSVRPEAGKWVLRFPKVSPGEGAEIVVAHEPLNLRIVLRIAAAGGNSAKAHWTKVLGTEAAGLVVVEAGTKEWVVKADPGLEIAAKGDLSVNTVPLRRFTPLVRTKVSRFYLVSRRDLAPWKPVADRYYRAIVEGNWNAFVACYNKFDRRNARQYATVQIHWRAAQRLVQNQAVVRYEFVRLDERRSTPTRKKLFYRRINKKGEQVGLPLPIYIENEDDVWVVFMATQ